MEKLPREQQHAADDDEVERHEQLVAERADAHGNGREGEKRQEPRHTTERRSEESPDRERGHDLDDVLPGVVRREREGDHADAEQREAEPGDPVAPRAGQEEDGEPEARDGAAEAGELGHRTVTTARSEWPCSVTTST